MLGKDAKRLDGHCYRLDRRQDVGRQLKGRRDHPQERKSRTLRPATAGRLRADHRVQHLPQLEFEETIEIVHMY